MIYGQITKTVLAMYNMKWISLSLFLLLIALNTGLCVINIETILLIVHEHQFSTCKVYVECVPR